MNEDFDNIDGDLPSDPKEAAKVLAQREAKREVQRQAQQQTQQQAGAVADSGTSLAADVAETAAEVAGEASWCFLESLFSSSGGGGGGGCCLAEASFDVGGLDCFIATATMGPQHPDLDVLRAFRDRVLKRWVAGRIFITLYYRYGAYAAAFIEDKPRLKWVIRETVVRPLARLAHRVLG